METTLEERIREAIRAFMADSSDVATDEEMDAVAEIEEVLESLEASR